MKKNYLIELPHDIIEYIYSIIYCKQKAKILEEIKLIYLIKNYILLKYDIKMLCITLLIYNIDINNIDIINIINNISDKISYQSDNELYKLFNITINKFSLKDKYKYIFNLHDYRIRGINSIRYKCIKIFINNIQKKFINNRYI
tara:strand:- start:8164 stop:8595 length:432 start_codon:yes stop_codon:yes gene_type:complete